MPLRWRLMRIPAWCAAYWQWKCAASHVHATGMCAVSQWHPPREPVIPAPHLSASRFESIGIPYRISVLSAPYLSHLPVMIWLFPGAIYCVRMPLAKAVRLVDAGGGRRAAELAAEEKAREKQHKCLRFCAY